MPRGNMLAKKSPFWGGFPCVRCGYCCKKATCSIGLTHGAGQTDCMFLIGNKPGEYSCLLVDKKMYPSIRMHLGIGSGCCEPLNTDRKRVLERSKNEPV